MNVFLACFLAVVFAGLVKGAARATFYRVISYRMIRRARVVPSPIEAPGLASLDVADAMRRLRAQEDAKLSLEIAADSYSLAPGQVTLDDLCAAAAAFGKTQTAQSRDARKRYADYARRIAGAP